MKKSLIFLIIGIFIVSFIGSVSAVPSVSSVSGSISNGQTITINGSGFGRKADPGPLISSYDNANSLNNWHSGILGGDWYWMGSPNIGSSLSYRRSATYQSDHYVDCAYSGGYNSVGKIDSNLGTEYYVSFWHQITSPTFTCSSGGGNSKIWLWNWNSDGTSKMMEAYSAASSSGGPAITYMAGADGFTGTLTGVWDNFLSWMPYQLWHHEEMWMHGSTEGAATFVRTTIDGKSARYLHGFDFSPSHTFSSIRMGVSSGRNIDGGSILLDQVYIDNTQAHVFISDRSDITDWLGYSSFAHNEIQIPTAWSNNSISITLNQGSFNSGDTVYLYVVDPNGTASAGYPIIISGYVSDTIPPILSNPQPTTNLSSGTNQTTISLTTDELANCKYSLISGVSYSSMINTFTTTGGTNHSTNITNLEDGSSYTYYVRCTDSSGNANTNDYVISFSVATPASTCGEADNNPTDETVSITELMSYISLWESGNVAIGELMTAIGEWKNGC